MGGREFGEPDNDGEPIFEEPEEDYQSWHDSFNELS